ncbi:MAG: helix-turn-helix domain-containing protein, partial [Chloroflexi bacterium]|nr:helix-turn-helix domain-containing protein [Chloroflexota bacterium]
MDPTTCWQSVLDRSRDADGAFVFAVHTTGIYCRPSCGARRAKRENVAFFALPADAEAAGFRACRRCRPNDALSPDQRTALVREICRMLDADDAGELTLGYLSVQTGVSPQHLQRTFKQTMGVSPRQYAAARRLDRLKARLRDGAAVTD